MEFLNRTGAASIVTQGLDADGSERLVIILKRRYLFPVAGSVLTPAEGPATIRLTDDFHGEPGVSATRWEADVAPLKPACDVVVCGSAHAPGGTPCRTCEVALRVADGRIDKRFRITGPRTWHRGWIRTSPTDPDVFVTQPVHYGVAFGGPDAAEPDPEKRICYAGNPIGMGWATHRRRVDQVPMPRTEGLADPVRLPDGTYIPMSLSVLPRNTASRIALAGTYDQRWRDETAPLLPEDFQSAYHQCAPPDQQMPFPTGGELIELHNLTPEGTTTFRLPALDQPGMVIGADHTETDLPLAVDTIAIDADTRTVDITWRASQPLRESLHEIASVIVGTMSAGWHRARRLGKSYYPSVADLIASTSRRNEA